MLGCWLLGQEVDALCELMGFVSDYLYAEGEGITRGDLQLVSTRLRGLIHAYGLGTPFLIDLYKRMWGALIQTGSRCVLLHL